MPFEKRLFFLGTVCAVLGIFLAVAGAIADGIPDPLPPQVGPNWRCDNPAYQCNCVWLDKTPTAVCIDTSTNLSVYWCYQDNIQNGCTVKATYNCPGNNQGVRAVGDCKSNIPSAFAKCDPVSVTTCK
jgi:hypothetical protein